MRRMAEGVGFSFARTLDGCFSDHLAPSRHLLAKPSGILEDQITP
jgi:hypothetical protein